MRLRGVGSSRNVVDRRGQRGGGVGRAGGIGGLGLLLVLAIGYFTGVDVTPILTGAPGAPGSSGPADPAELSPQERQAGEFAARVLTTTETVWTEVFRDQLGRQYDPPRMVLFSGVTASPCGNASGATGPFYCPQDQMAYLDTAFFAELSSKLGARGDFAAAYVIAHEVAHHVQDELGILGKVNEMRQRGSEAQSNALSVRIELQADCLSGVWAAHVQDLLDPGDVDEAMNAAQKIGDDYLMRRAGRVPNPHAYTHGTSEQRQRWFATGYRSGEVADCDTFGAQSL